MNLYRFPSGALDLSEGYAMCLPRFHIKVWDNGIMTLPARRLTLGDQVTGCGNILSTPLSTAAVHHRDRPKPNHCSNHMYRSGPPSFISQVFCPHRTTLSTRYIMCLTIKILVWFWYGSGTVRSGAFGFSEPHFEKSSRLATSGHIYAYCWLRAPAFPLWTI